MLVLEKYARLLSAPRTCTLPSLSILAKAAPSHSARLLVCPPPQFPERVYRLPSPAVSVQFARLQPHLLAVGLADGAVHLCDVSSFAAASVLDSACVRASL